MTRALRPRSPETDPLDALARPPARLRDRIVCFGNPLHGDDGVGPAVAARLAEGPLPDGVAVVDAGTPGPAALALFENCDRVIVVDASAPAGAPGRVWSPTVEEIAPENVRAGHGVGVGHLLACLAALGAPPPRVEILAVEAASVAAFRPGLSAPVARAVDEVAARLRRIVEATP